MKTSRSNIFPVGRSLRLGTAVSLISIPLAMGAFAQESNQETERTVAATAASVVPQQVRYAGKLAARAGQTVAAEFRIYSAQEGGEPLWTETQQFPVATDGSYSVLLGGATAAGLPQSVFAGGAARWLGVSVERAPETERVVLSSVPYAMKSADAESLAGHAASDFVTQEQLATITASSEAVAKPVGPGGFQPLDSGTITGSGTAGNVAVFTGANTIGNSDIVQVGNDVGINVTTPAALLDVGGTATVRGTLDLPALNTATATTGYNSNSLELGSSAWSTTTAGPVTQNFFLENLATGNNTASPGAKIDLLFASGSGNPAATGLSFGSNGLINFAAGQTFPGASTITTITTASPLTGGGSSGPLTLSLSLPTLEASLDAVFPQLATGNTFKASQSITGSLTTSVAVNTAALNATTASIEGLTTAIGGINVGNSVQMHQINLATPTTPYNSPYFQFIGSAYNSSTAAAQNETFAWQTVVTGNNTASPSAFLQLLSGSGSSQAATGLTISPSGVINFVPAQTFPGGGGGGGGTITGITTSSPLTGSGTTGSVALGFNTAALEATLSMVYPQLGTSNIFTGTQTINSGGLNVGGALFSNSVVTGSASSAGGYSSNGLVNLTPGTTATPMSTSDSPLLEISGSAYSSSLNMPVAQNFAWQTVDSGNDTASPTANLELLFGSGSTTPAATGFSISPSGTLNFAAGQTFPGTGTGNGTITGITTASPLTGSGTSGSVGLGLNTTALETTLNSVYAQLGAANTFTAPITFAAGQTFPGTIASVGASSPLTATTTNGAVSVGLNTSSLETTLNGVYPTLAGNNTFAGTATFSKAVTFNGAGQSFPNTVSSLTATSPLAASASTGAVTVSLNTSALATTLNGDYAQLAASNTFSGANNTFNGMITAAGSLTADGYSETDNAVIATGTNGAYGVVASSDSGIAVLGDAGTSAMDSIQGRAGVFGINFQASSNSLQSLDRNFYAGVWGDTSGPTGSAGIRPVGVIGTADDNFAGYFLNGGPYYPALYAESSGINGIIAKSDATGDGQSGVLGIGNTQSNTYSVYTDGSEVYAAGVWGDNGNSTTTTSPLWNAGVIGTSDDARAGAFINDSSKYAALYAFDLNTGTSGTLFTTFMAGSPNGSCGVGSSGDMSCTGRVKALVSVGGGARKVETYAVQSPESWMEDFGAGELQNGVAVVKLDPAFAETISADASYHVFITPNGDSESLYVIKKTANSFEVRESKGGRSSLTFDYRIVAKRRGYEGERLTDVTERFNTEKALATPPEAHGTTRNARPAEYAPDKIGRPETEAQTSHKRPAAVRVGASAQAPVHE